MSEQYAYFSIKSDDLTPDEITSLVGLAADEVRVKGSKRPNVPTTNHWKILADRTLPIEDQIEQLVERLEPYQDAIAAAGQHSVLQLVRTPRQDLGLHLSRDVLAFTSGVGASIDIDEYDYSE